jgi:hypothetical protein
MLRNFGALNGQPSLTPNAIRHFLSILLAVSVKFSFVQGVIESCTDILTTSYWLHVELGENI